MSQALTKSGKYWMLQLKAVPLNIGMVVLLCVVAGLLWVCPVAASTDMSVTVKTILASNQSDHVDARCKPFIEDLQSVFRYSSYKCLGESKMNLNMGNTGKAALPGSRMMHITPMEKDGNRVKLRLEIFKKEKQVFQTVVQLLNGGTLTVGGPNHDDGVLLFNISGSF